MQKARPGAIRTGGSSVGTGVLDGPLFYRRGDSRIARNGVFCGRIVMRPYGFNRTYPNFDVIATT
jgi:hypothetical protein